MSRAEMASVSVGSRALPKRRVGMLLPSGNVVAEHQIPAMLPKEFSLQCTRLPLTGSSEAQLTGMIERLEEASKLLAHARVEIIGFNCTAVSTYAPGSDSQVADRIHAATGIRGVTTGGALVKALQHLGVRRVALVTPYITAVTEREVAFFAYHGLEVVGSASYGLDSNWEMAQQAPETWQDFTIRNRADDAEAYVLSCTAIQTAPIIDALEQRLDRPVVTSDQALVWQCLQACGWTKPVTGYGRLLRGFENPAPATAEPEAASAPAAGR